MGVWAGERCNGKEVKKFKEPVTSKKLPRAGLNRTRAPKDGSLSPSFLMCLAASPLRFIK